MDGWKELLGQNVLESDSHNIQNTIAEAIRKCEDAEGIQGGVMSGYSSGQSEVVTFNY